MNVEPVPAPILEKKNNILQGAQRIRKPIGAPSAPSVSPSAENVPDVLVKNGKRTRTPKQLETLRKAREKKRAKYLSRIGVTTEASENRTTIEPKQEVIKPGEILLKIHEIVREMQELEGDVTNPISSAGPIGHTEAGKVHKEDASYLTQLFGDLPDVFKPSEQMTKHSGNTWQEGRSPFIYKGTSITRILNETPNNETGLFTLGISSDREIAKIETQEKNPALHAFMKQRNPPNSSKPGYALESFHDTKRVGLTPSILRRNTVSGNVMAPMPTSNSF